MSIQANFPAIKPTLLLDFANTEALDPRITFTRASTGTYYDGKTVAKAEENLLTYSQEFDNAAWTPAGTVTSNVTLAPDGTLTADRCAVVSGAALSQIVNGITAGINYTISVWAKSSATGGASNVRITTNNTGAWNTGVSQIYALTSEWQRITISGAIISSGTSVRLMIGAYTVGGGGDATCAGNIDVWGAQLEQRASATAYTPTTTQAVTTYIPVLQTAASGVPRFEHNPVTGESLGLEIEEQRTNLLTYSEQFDNAAWTKSNTTVTANTIVAPDGTLTGDKVVESNSTSRHEITLASAIAGATAGATYTLSLFAKAAGRSYVEVFFATGEITNNPYAIFDLANGTVSYSSGATASIISTGNGFYRCSITAIPLSTTITPFLGIVNTASTARLNSYTGDGFSGIYIWGAQLEAGAFPTSYIPTVASQVTRAADSAVMTGANFSSWYRQGQGTLFAEASSVSPEAGNFITSISQAGSSSNMVALTMTSGKPSSLIITNAATQTLTSISSVTLQSNVAFKDSVAYSTNNASVAGNGVGSALISTLLVPRVEQLNIGLNAVGGQHINGTIRKLTYYPQRLSNAELVEMTA